MNAPETPQPCHVFSDDALGRDDATALAERIRCRDISITEITRAAVARARAAQPLIHGVTSANYDEAIRTASRLDASGQTGSLPLFRGVPTFIKDNTDVEGLATRHGSLAVPDAAATDTSPFARQLMAQ
ncbi:MAG: amidase, partial [Marinobacter sp.]|nr:amidase [Marinobacter sp.]